MAGSCQTSALFGGSSQTTDSRHIETLRLLLIVGAPGGEQSALAANFICAPPLGLHSCVAATVPENIPILCSFRVAKSAAVYVAELADAIG